MAIEQAVISLFGAGATALGSALTGNAASPDIIRSGVLLVDRIVTAADGPDPRPAIAGLALKLKRAAAGGTCALADIERLQPLALDVLALGAFTPADVDAPAPALASRLVGDSTAPIASSDRASVEQLLASVFAELADNRAFLEAAAAYIPASGPAAAATAVAPPTCELLPEATGVSIADTIDRTQAACGLPRPILAEIAAAALRRKIAPADIETKLGSLARIAAELGGLLLRSESTDQVVKRLRAEAHAALYDGHFDEADALLSGAEARDLSASVASEVDRRQRRRAAADTRGQRALLEELRLDYRKAARHYEAAATSLADDEVEIRWRYALKQGDALNTEGDEFDDIGALETAVVIFARALELQPRKASAQHWAITQNHLGNALLSLGTRERNREKIALAATSYRRALEVETRERSATAWALLQGNVGAASMKLADLDPQRAHVADAVEAFRFALEVFTRDKAPADWALSQMNLAAALSRLGSFDDDASPLEGAATAYQAALEETDREGAPEEWARLQNSLGNVLSELGERSRDTRWLEMALIAYEAALSHWTMARAPMQWALTTANLGNTLWALGGMTSAANLLQDAAGKIIAALGVFRERGETQYERTALDNLKALHEDLKRLAGVTAAAG